MATNASVYRDDMPRTEGVDLPAARKWGLALLCLAGAIAPLAARSLPGEPAGIVYGPVVAGVLLATTLLLSRSAALRGFWRLPYACFVLAVVQVLNNAVPPFVLTHVLHEHTLSGNPLASTTVGTLVIQLLETALAIVPIVVLVKLAGLGLGSIYWRPGSAGHTRSPSPASSSSMP